MLTTAELTCMNLRVTVAGMFVLRFTASARPKRVAKMPIKAQNARGGVMVGAV